MPSTGFLWASGIEDTFVPQVRGRQRPLDEYALMGHYEHWREDLDLVRDVGVSALRWGIPWYRVESTPGDFDWRWVDQVLNYAVGDLGLTVIADLIHYGCPSWLQGGFASPDYPAIVANYASEFAWRYRGLVRWYTPLNEPTVTAEMCGRRGLWPPYLRGVRGYVRLVMQLVKGIVATVNAIRQADPDAVMVHVEASGPSYAAHAALEALRLENELLQYLSYDLLTGGVTSDHLLFPWLLRHGASYYDLEQVRASPISLDVIGLNFYPQWSSRQLYFDREGKVGSRITDPEGAGFGELIRLCHRRFHAPVMITETSAFGTDAQRSAWLRSSLAAIKDLRRDGVPVVGYTWFPLFTMIDWRYRLGARPLREYRIELGLYRLQDEGTRWRPTALVEEMRACIVHSEEVVGSLAEQGSDVQPAG